MVNLFLVQAVLIIGIPLGIWLLPAVRKVVPLVVLQILIGFLLGPSLLGKITSAYSVNLFPSDASWFVDGLAFYGVLLFIFVTGTHLEAPQLVRGSDRENRGTDTNPSPHEFWTIAISSLLVPMAFGVIVAALLWQQWPHLQGLQATPFSFILVLGLATGITALPVLSAILIESNRIDTPVGKFVLSTATVHDAVLWILLTILLTYTNVANESVRQPLINLLYIVGYACFILFVVRPLLVRLEQSTWWVTLPAPARYSIEVVGLFFSAYATESIGVHYLIGAVLYGAILPDSVKKVLVTQVEPVVVALLLPFFFVSVGMQTTLEIADPVVWIVFLMMTTAKLGGQLVGTTLPLRVLFGRSWSFSLQSGIYMTCAGIVEIVVLSLAYERGLISNTAYAGMMFSALTTTAATKPLVAAIRRIIQANTIPHTSTSL
jgi:Kef-type K+ transport system membrane component KefB